MRFILFSLIILTFYISQLLRPPLSRAKIHLFPFGMEKPPPHVLPISLPILLINFNNLFSNFYLFWIIHIARFGIGIFIVLDLTSWLSLKLTYKISLSPSSIQGLILRVSNDLYWTWIFIGMSHSHIRCIFPYRTT